MKKPLLFIFAFIMLQCSRKPENDTPPILSNEIELSKDDTSGTGSQKNPLHYLGMYKGIIPGVGSNKTAVVIELSETFSFTVSTDTVANAKKIIQKGTFKWKPDGKSLILTANSGLEKEYRVTKNKLSLKENGEVMVFEKMKSAEIIDFQSETTPAKITTFIDQKWSITSINDKPVSAKGIKKDYYAFFAKDRKFQAYAGCNQIGGDYAIKGDQIKMKNITSTEMACLEMEMEKLLLQALAEADNIIQNDQYMYLRKKGEVLIKFQAQKQKK